MYNLLVSAAENAWEYPTYEYDRIRIFEYTPEYFIKEFKTFSNNTIDKLTKIPSLFIHEIFEGKSKIGYIKKIKQNYEKYHLTLDFICEISSEKLSYLQNELDFGKFEINRTHWAVKDIDLVSVLLEKKILTNEQALFFRMPIPLPKNKFDIAFSFPGEKRGIISEIVDNLKAKKVYSVFYDKDFVEQLAMPDMDLILMNVYKKQSRLICILLSKEYQNKKWCQLEWKAVREIITERKDSIMFLRYDDSDISGVSSNDGYIGINQYTPEQISAFIQNRLRTITQVFPEKLNRSEHDNSVIGKVNEMNQSVASLSSATSHTGKVKFNYMSNSGNFIICTGEYEFRTHWSTAGIDNIHAYKDYVYAIVLSSIDVSLDKFRLQDYDFSSRTRTAAIGESLIWINQYGKIMISKIENIEYESDQKRWLEISYQIATMLESVETAEIKENI